MEKAIRAILSKRNSPSLMVARRDALQTYVIRYGVKNTALAAGLKESTLKQYLRQKHPLIGSEPLEQASHVFASKEFEAAFKAQEIE
ncbi:hypothetical protein S144_56 [Shewanella sp. phage 1/44]|uniref:hypothetical protein n=1 Tax=Shewanella sp. phage 1/44 TaxID=1458862 RepID=UPI0004F6A818|nr:hypothetical protein S144_56 [Shewanella sp. phage 1/44]AHK11770.1 hypothetical protein S144_56 [Shewanella sp. phage 1/44]